MKWKFWDKAQAPTREVPDWPSDAYQSVKYLFGFYAMQDSMPFLEFSFRLSAGYDRGGLVWHDLIMRRRTLGRRGHTCISAAA
jgi:hypothetical protein